MPDIAGQNFPAYAYQEFPKTLYEGGELDGDTRVVATIGEQEAAAADGFLPIVSEPPAGSAIDSDPDHVLVDAGEPQDQEPADEPDGDFNGADPADFDHDGDGKPGGSKARKGK